ncbi:MAG: SUMF1/EgtB/PvdO family nonheme iron enzyme [Bacteroidia bacterium]|nr:SUMF1/EgtB/PvdO family nonheme iron enzyme [Bacteroidia bacterium]
MKKYFTFILISGATIILSAFYKLPKRFSPPGAVQINDTLWYDQTEMSNINWREFVGWVEKEYGHDSRQYIKALPDTLVWREKNSYNEPYVNYYYRHVAYNNFPVVGISYEQAVDFCKWRTDRVKEYLLKQDMGKTYVFEYRLPDKSEWQGVSLLGWGKKAKMMIRSGKYNNNRPYNLNYLSGDMNGIAGTIANKGADITSPCESNFPNEKDLYNLFGNVAEMTRERGKSVGGGWIHTLEQSEFNNTVSYEKPASWLGFRCVCVVKNP